MSQRFTLYILLAMVLGVVLGQTIHVTLADPAPVAGYLTLVTDLFLRNFPANSLFLENAVDWMTSGSELISIISIQ